MFARWRAVAILTATFVAADVVAPRPASAQDALAGCRGLVPAPLPPPFTVDLSVRSNDSQACGLARPDGDGTVLLWRTEPGDLQSRWTRWIFYGSDDGTVLQSVRMRPGEIPGSVLARAALAVRPEAFATDPGGGIAVAGVLRVGATSTVLVQRFDKDGRVESTQELATHGPSADKDAVRVTAVGVTVFGHALVFWQAGEGCFARWVDGAGTLLTEEFPAPACRPAGLLPLLDGSLVVQSPDARGDPVVSARMIDASTASTAPPPFLRDNPRLGDEGLFLLPAGKGYALRDRSARDELRLFDREGNACGKLILPDLSPGTFAVGRDGTLVTQSHASGGCTFQWWPRLLK